MAARIAATHRRAAARSRRLAAAEDERLAAALLNIAADKAAEGTLKRAHSNKMQSQYADVRTTLDSGRGKATSTNRPAATASARRAASAKPTATRK